MAVENYGYAQVLNQNFKKKLDFNNGSINKNISRRESE